MVCKFQLVTLGYSILEVTTDFLIKKCGNHLNDHILHSSYLSNLWSFFDPYYFVYREIVTRNKLQATFLFHECLMCEAFYQMLFHLV